MSEAASIVAYYRDRLVRILDGHTAAHRANWTDTMRDLRVRGFDLKHRKLTLDGYDDEWCEDIVTHITFLPVSFPPLEASAVCSCEESKYSSYCRHTYAAAQLATRLLTNPKDPLTRGLVGPDSASAESIARASVTKAKAAPAAPRRSPQPPTSAPQPVQTPVAPKLMNTLDQVLHAAEIRNDADPLVADRRLAYRVIVDNARSYFGPVVTVIPYEQILRKDGADWKKGRHFNWNMLETLRDIPLNQYDEAAIALARERAHNYQTSPPVGAVLNALAGCDRITMDDATGELPATVRSGAVSIDCRLDSGNLHIEVLCDGKPFDSSRGIIEQCGINGLVAIGQDSLTVVNVPNQQAIALAVEFSREPVTVPLFEAAPLIERLVRLDVLLPVKLPGELVSQDVIADPRMHLELIPGHPQGLAARLRVRPVPTGPMLMPGGKKTGSYLQHNDTISRVSRDQDAERQKAKSLINELDASSLATIGEYDWQFRSDDAAMDFLARLSDRQRRRLKEQAADQTSARQPVNDNDAATSLGKIPDTDDLVITWPQGGVIRVTGEIDSSSLRISIEDKEDWFGLDGSVEVDGHTISLRALIAALKSGRKYISLGNGLYVRISDEFLERLQAIDDLVHSTKNGLEVDITAAPALQDLVHLREHFQLCAKWQNVLRNLDTIAVQNADPPPTLNAQLRHYQLDGYHWLKRLSTWGVGGCLADDMGLGKTVQALAVLLDRRETGPALVIAPMSVGFNWVRETQRFAPSLQVISYRDSDRGQILQDVQAGDVVVVSYALFQRDAAKFGSVDWGTLVLDEAQNVKNPATKTARAVRDLKAQWRLALTGTPIENRLSELWALFRAISPGLFGSWERFRERFAAPIEKDKDPAKRRSLARLVKPFILRRTKQEVLTELPPRTDIQHTIELSSEERKRYEDARLAICTQLAGVDLNSSAENHRFTVLAAITKLRQLACHPRLVDEKWTKSSAKLDTFMELVEELREEQHRALVFSQFTQHLGLARQALDRVGIQYQYLDGSSSAASRQRSVDAFQAGEGDLFLISLKAGGSGLNLTAADYVIHLDPWWNPAVEDQATDRAHRIGQLRPVTVYRLVTESTIEEKILALHERKRELVASVLDGTDEAAQLSTEELVDLIKGSATNSADRSEEAPSRPRRKTSHRHKS